MSGQAEERVFLGLGGNLGDPARAMGEALRLLDQGPDTRVAAVSPLYRTPPWGKLDQPDFFNAAAEVATGLSPRGLLDLCLDAERKLKRVRAERWGPRVVDIDVLAFEGVSAREAGLDLPHPRMLERAFVLTPLAEIAPDLVVEGHTVADRAAALGGEGIVRLDGGSDWRLRTP